MPERTVLVVNTGSTSVKLGLFSHSSPENASSNSPEKATQRETTLTDAATLTQRWAAEVTSDELGPDRVAGIERELRAAPIDPATLAAVGHRIVHGADRFDGPAIIDSTVEDGIRSIAHLAPLHNLAGLDGIAAARRVLDPNVPQVAVFDTTFHRTIPMAAAAYGGPHEWIGQGLRRYGFHGISHEWAAHRAAAMLGRPLSDLRLVTCHLGGGCSLAAIDGGCSVDTTMGFTPLDGLVMATRSGSIDPGLILHLLRTGTSIDTLDDLLQHRSGLLGLSGVSGDLRAVAVARDAGNERARLAFDVFVHRLAAGVGAMAATLGGFDALVFTGGIGEHSAEVRARVSSRFAFAGVVLDDAANTDNAADASSSGDADVSSPRSVARVLIVASREDLAIAHIALATAEASRAREADASG